MDSGVEEVVGECRSEFELPHRVAALCPGQAESAIPNQSNDRPVSGNPSGERMRNYRRSNRSLTAYIGSIGFLAGNPLRTMKNVIAGQMRRRPTEITPD